MEFNLTKNRLDILTGFQFYYGIQSKIRLGKQSKNKTKTEKVKEREKKRTKKEAKSAEKKLTLTVIDSLNESGGRVRVVLMQ